MANTSSFMINLMGKGNSSKNIAKERLKLVLLHDRADFSPALVNKIKDEIVQVLSKYLDIDMSCMDVELTRLGSENNVSALVANIPIRGVKEFKR